MTQDELVSSLEQGPVPFDQVIAVIDANYQFTPTEFQNGEQHNEAGTNNGSCKIFAFAKLQGLSEQATLNAFGDFYTRDVLGNPEGSDHGNIRNFIRSGWNGMVFTSEALAPL